MSVGSPLIVAEVSWRADGKSGSCDALDLAQAAVAEWQAFFKKHKMKVPDYYL
jgi:hypothetical protein